MVGAKEILMVNPICSELLELSSPLGSVLLSNPERIAFGPRAWAEYSVRTVNDSANPIAQTITTRLLNLIKLLICSPAPTGARLPYLHQPARAASPKRIIPMAVKNIKPVYAPGSCVMAL